MTMLDALGNLNLNNSGVFMLGKLSTKHERRAQTKARSAFSVIKLLGDLLGN